MRNESIYFSTEILKKNKNTTTLYLELILKSITLY